MLPESTRIVEVKVVEAEGRSYSFDDVDAVDNEILETFPYEYEGESKAADNAVVDISTEEFSAVCPFSGLPDYGTLTVRYTPKSVCVELKSFKYYLLSFRNVGIYQEHAANLIFEDLEKCLQPRWLEVGLDYKLRGGIRTVVTVSSKDR